MNIARRAALRATLFGLHVGAVFAGTECVLIWAVFRWSPAAVVGGIAYVVAGVLALLAYPRTFAHRQRVILARGLRVYLYSMALIAVGALLTRDGARTAGVGPPGDPHPAERVAQDVVERAVVVAVRAWPAFAVQTDLPSRARVEGSGSVAWRVRAARARR